jgi:hypothetical protein
MFAAKRFLPTIITIALAGCGGGSSTSANGGASAQAVLPAAPGAATAAPRASNPPSIGSTPMMLTPGSVGALASAVFENGREWATSFTPYAGNSVWNTHVSGNPTIASYSAQAIAKQFPGAGSSSSLQIREPGPNDYGHPIYYASASDPVVKLSCTQYCGAPDNGGVPQSMYIPAKARPAGGTDAQMAVIQPDGTEIDFWAAYGTPGSDKNWTAPHNVQNRDWQSGDTLSAGNIANCGSITNGSGFMAVGPGATAADQCLAGGQVKVNELIQGGINHALALELTCAVGSTYPAPPGANTQQCTSGIGVPLGSRLWYDVPDDVTNANPRLKPWERAILNALHDYGAFFTDNGSGGAFAVGMGIEFSDIPETSANFGFADPVAVLGTQGWVGSTVSQLPPRDSGSRRWFYPDTNGGQWNPDGVDFSAHMHWLDACSARNSC